MKKALALGLTLALSLSLLAGCTKPAADPAPTGTTPPAPSATTPAAYTYADTVAWDGQYDVVVIGFGGAGACVHGCLGNGDCVAICPVSAIHMEQGIAVVDRDLCIGCGLCEKTCPNGVIGIMPKRQVVYDRCSNFEFGKAVMDVCKAGCIGCGKCSKTCPSEAITMDNKLAQVDPTKCTACGACVEACPTHCMTMVKK